MPFRTKTYLKLISNLDRIYLPYPLVQQRFYTKIEKDKGRCKCRWFNPHVRGVVVVVVEAILHTVQCTRSLHLSSSRGCGRCIFTPS